MLRVVNHLLLSFLLASLFTNACFSAITEDKVNASLADQKNSVFTEIRSGGGDGAKLDVFLKEYYLARWTVQANARELHNYRKELQQDLTALTGEGRKNFLNAVVKVLTSYAVSNERYPACRYNAILAIGTLDDISGGQPVPFTAVLKRLCDFCSSDKVVLPDYVRLGALVGIVRHTEFGIPDDELKKTVQALLLNILSPTYQAEKNYRPEVVEWFQIKAMQGLTNFKSPGGPKGSTETIDVLRGILEDKNTEAEIRCLAARALGTMNFDSIKNYDFVPLARSLALAMRDLCKDELKFISVEAMRDQIKNDAGGGMGGGMGMSMGMGMGGEMSSGGMGMESGMGMDPMMMGGGMSGMGSFANMTPDMVTKVENIIARVKFDVDSIQVAITGNQTSGVKGMLPSNQKDAIDQLDNILTSIKNTIEFLDNGVQPEGVPGRVTKPKPAPKKRQAGLNVPRVDIPMIKDYLEEQLIYYNELLGIYTN